MNLARVTQPTESSSFSVALTILAEIFKYRRSALDRVPCLAEDCPRCQNTYLHKIQRDVSLNRPITFVLPAFPGKSPNLAKVLGPLPDQAERQSLKFLSEFCKKIQKHHSPGAKIILCSDGRVFSDIVGIHENDLNNYQIEIAQIIRDLNLFELSLFNLDDVYLGLDFSQMRMELLKRWGVPVEALKHKIKNGATPSATLEEQEANRMYRGITRFLYEDSLWPGQTQSGAQLQKEAKNKAYELIRRSNAWSELIAERFPDALRLSIHPQSCASKKIGIRLIGNESWMTPWHGVLLETGSGHILSKRAQAEALGARLVLDSSGRPSHYSLLHIAERTSS